MYMAVTADKYELPLCVADTVAELAAYAGMTVDSMYCAISRKTAGKNRGMRFVRVAEPHSKVRVKLSEPPIIECKTRGVRMEDYIVRKVTT